MISIRILLTIILFLFFSLSAICENGNDEPQISGLDDWTLFIDPGHSQQENMGLYNYSEAEKVLQVALELRDMFEGQTDIKEVYMARATDDEYISLSGRTDLANELGADFYYSIHSDAGAPQNNSTLMLYGGWRSEGETVEKDPQGGAAYGEILDHDLTGAMRIDRRGLFADRVFYLGAEHHHQNQWPYLHVNRTTDMTSLLSEAGFHTNPDQQRLNLNSEWKKLEALSAFRSFLEFHDIDRPEIGVVTGIIYDEDTGKPINGITVEIDEKVYVTDTYESLFQDYSDDPDQLSNGFYWISGLSPLEEVEVTFSSDYYQSKTRSVEVLSDPNGRTADNLTFLDVELTSIIPATVKSVSPQDELESLMPGSNIEIEFSRKMDQESVENGVSIDNDIELNFQWKDDFTLILSFENLQFLTDYTITIDGGVAKNLNTGQFLDGNSDGDEGGDYILEFTTAEEDTTPPELISHTPGTEYVVSEYRPIIRLEYDEFIAGATVSDDAVTLTALDGNVEISGLVDHIEVGDVTVIHFYPQEDLSVEGDYEVVVAAGLEDAYGNVTDEKTFQFVFEKPEERGDVVVIDAFDSSITGWWEPQQSGSTSGIVTEITGRTFNSHIANYSLDSDGSMELSFGWDQSTSGHYIRLYLSPSSAQNSNRFNADDILEVYLFGDGSQVEFRIMINDGDGQYEGTEWVNVDWKGWKRVAFDLAVDPVYGWVNGNGVLDGEDFYLDGFHFRSTSEGAESGTIYFDNLRFILPKDIDVSVPEIEVAKPVKFYPNPVQSVLNIESKEIIEEVRIYDIMGQLRYNNSFSLNNVEIDVSSFSQGMYVVTVVTTNEVVTSKIQIVE
ncbi:Ig-like domain-containing protein [Marinilabiliaceae bacterium ANBcel2]|nr:Ig-like domain-containing protein [Marinilabiliaceae bacterium ANBcel2]